MQPFNHALCKPINYSLQSISGMLLEAETKLRLRYFISTLVNSGLHCLGPQCNFICEGSEGRCDIIPSKCIVDVLEVKYGAKSPYAPALVDFISSHQGIHGTGSSSVLAYVCFILTELLLTDVSPESVAYSALVVESIFVDICYSLRVKLEFSSRDRSFVDDQNVDSNHHPSFTAECRIDRRHNEARHKEPSIADDLDWFFDDDDMPIETVTAPLEGYQIHSIKPVLLNPEVTPALVSTEYRLDSSCDAYDAAYTTANPTAARQTFADNRQEKAAACLDNRVEADRSISCAPPHSDLWLALGLQHCFAWEFELDNLKINEKHLSRGGSASAGESSHLSQGVPDRWARDANQPERDHLRKQGVALPMRLAMQAAKSLWIDDLSSRHHRDVSDVSENVHDKASNRHQEPDKSNKASNNRSEHDGVLPSSFFSISDSIRTFAVEQKDDEEEEYDYYSFSSELSLDDLVIHTIAGVPACYCDVFAGSLLSSCRKEAVMKNFELYAGSREGVPRDGAMKGTSIMFQGVAVVDTGWGTDAFDSGAMGEGAGASIEAHKLNYLHVKSEVTSSVPICEDRSSVRTSSLEGDGACVGDVKMDEMTAEEEANETSDSVYLVRSVSHMQQLGVTALCCSEAFCSQKLLDAFNSKGIAVFPLSARHLQVVADLAGAEIVGDILDLEAQCIGGPLCISEHPFLSMRASDSVRKVRTQEVLNKEGTTVMRQREDDEVLVEFSRRRYCEVTGLCSSASIEEKDRFGHEHSSRSDNSDSDEHKFSNARATVTSVIIASPTEAQTAALKDRFLRCLHRLRGVVQGAGVMPGAGLPELLMCLQLERDVESRTLQLSDMLAGDPPYDSGGGTSSISCTEDPSVIALDAEWREMRNGAGLDIDALRGVINALQALQRGLHAMIMDVSLSNGSSWAEAASAITASEQKIKSMLPEAFITPSTVLDTQGVRGHTSFQPVSVQASLRLRSAAELAALSLIAPIVIATDYMVNPTSLPSATGTTDNPETRGHSVHADSPAAAPHTSIYPVLDVVGIKVSSFKNAISAIKMFLSARITVTNT